MTHQDPTKTEIWDRAVALLLGPVVTSADRKRRRADALALTAAALRAANADDLTTLDKQTGDGCEMMKAIVANRDERNG